MNDLITLANRIARDRHTLLATEIELQLLELGFHSVEFPKRGPIRARYLGVTYELEA